MSGTAAHARAASDELPRLLALIEDSSARPAAGASSTSGDAFGRPRADGHRVTFLAAESPHHAPPPVAIVIGLTLVLAMLLTAALIVRDGRRCRRALHTCPRCGARAVRQARCERIAPRLQRVALECGQCDTWRRLVVENEVWRDQRRRLARDRRRLARRVRRSEAISSVAGCRVFTDEERTSP
jgi:hypothetical protein